MENSFLNKFFYPLKLNFFSLILFEFIYKAFGNFLLFPYLLHIIRNLITGFGTSLITTDNIRLIFNSTNNILICLILLIIVLYYFLLELTVICTGLTYGAENKRVNLITLFKDGLFNSFKYFSINNWLAFLLIIVFIPLLHIGLQSGISELLYLRLYISYYTDFITSNSSLFITAVVELFLLITFSLVFVFSVKFKVNIFTAIYLEFLAFKDNFLKTIKVILKVLIICLLIFGALSILLLALGTLSYLFIILLGNSNNISTQVYREFINIITPLIVTFITVFIVLLPLFYFSGLIGLTFNVKRSSVKINKGSQAIKVISLIILIVGYSIFQGQYISSLITDDSILVAQTGGIITGHRGNSYIAHESTASAFNSAIENGAEYIECDLQVTKDGALVISHAPYINTANGSLVIKDSTLDELKAENMIGLYQKEELGEKILTLEELIDLVNDRAKMNIELKKVINDSDLIQKVVDTVKSKGIQDKCFIASSYYPYMLAIEENYPEINTLFLTSSNYGDIENLTFDSLSLEQVAINSDTVKRLHLRGKTIHGWILDSEEEILNMLNNDVDYLIVNDVRKAQGVLADYRPDRLNQLKKLIELILYRV